MTALKGQTPEETQGLAPKERWFETGGIRRHWPDEAELHTVTVYADYGRARVVFRARGIVWTIPLDMIARHPWSMVYGVREPV